MTTKYMHVYVVYPWRPTLQLLPLQVGPTMMAISLKMPAKYGASDDLLVHSVQLWLKVIWEMAA